MPFYERQPYIQPLHQLIREIMTGEILVPRFQREGTEGTWSTDQRSELLDSVYKGFPVGTILLWSTTKDIATKNNVGGFVVPKRDPNEKRPRRLLLDGHQRLSTLVLTLGQGLAAELASEGMQPKRNETETIVQEVWVFELGSAPENENRFRILRQDEDIEASLVIPLNIIFNRAELNKWIRRKLDDKVLVDEQVLAIDALRDRLREYAIPVAVLLAEDLDQATESFKRINSAGTPMGWVAMVSALAYRSDFDLQEILSNLHTEVLEPIGWKDVTDSDILRVCSGLVEGEHPAKPKVEKLAKALQEDPSLIHRAVAAVAAAATMLKKCDVLGPTALPYTWQLITIAIAMNNVKEKVPYTQQRINQIVKWFWITTYGQVFQGVNSAVYDRSNRALLAMIGGGVWTAMERDVTRHVSEVTRFDFRAARAKACALTMARFQEEQDDTSNARLALREGASAMKVLRPGGQRSQWWDMTIWSSANEIDIRECKEALRRVTSDKSPTENDLGLLIRLGVLAVDGGSIDSLLDTRRDAILAAEKARVASIGLTWKDV